MKKFLKYLFYLLLSLYFLLLLGGSLALSKGKDSDLKTYIPSRTKVSFLKTEGKSFLSTNDVLSSLKINKKDTTKHILNTEQMEKDLKARSPYIKDVQLYIAPISNTLSIDITERTPILSYFTGARSMYIDAEGILFSNRRGAAYVTVVTGNDISDDYARQYLKPLGIYFHEHPDLKGLFGSADLRSPRELWLYPRVGNFVFTMDPTLDLDDQLSKVSIFYKKILPHAGANKYKFIKLSYHNQIVCKKQ